MPHPGSRLQSEGAAARQHNAVHLSSDVARLQRIDRRSLAGRAADIHAAYRAGFA